jgi:hypothetical protein
VVDQKTTCTWAMGAYFGSEDAAIRMCEKLKVNYSNPDLIVHQV